MDSHFGSQKGQLHGCALTSGVGFGQAGRNEGGILDGRSSRSESTEAGMSRQSPCLALAVRKDILPAR